MKPGQYSHRQAGCARVGGLSQPIHSGHSAKQKATGAHLSRNTDAGPGDKRRVLVVDDEASIVDAVATSLRYEGFEVDEASTGRAALTAAQDRPPT